MPIRIGERIHWGEDRKSPNINEDSTYIVKIYGKWYLGQFSMQWYGWSFDDWGTSGVQLNPESGTAIGLPFTITEIYLLKKLKNIPRQLRGRAAHC